MEIIRILESMGFSEWVIFWQSVIIILYIILLAVEHHTKPKFFNAPPHISKHDILIIVYGLCAMAIIIVPAISSGIISYYPRFSSAFSAIIVAYIFIIVAPAEEILFRGIIQSTLIKKIGIFRGIILTSIIFGLAHLPNGALGINISLWNWKLALIAMIAGLILGWTYTRTKSIWNAAILHGILSSAYFIFLN